MTKIKYINTDVFQYVPIEDAFNECTRITNLTTGITESLSPADKLFYVRMRHRHQFFVNERGGTYYDDIDQLGASIGISSSTATRIVAKLKKVGLVVATLSGRSNKWTILPLTPDNLLFERDINAMERGAAPEWVDCLKHPVFGNVKEDVAPEVKEEKQQSVPEPDPMCEMDEIEVGEDEPPVIRVERQTVKPKQKRNKSKPVQNDPFEFSSPRDETKDWFYLKHYQGAERFTTFTDFDLPYLALFKAQGALTNPYALDYLQLRTDQIQRQLARNT
ncbi:MULTISPECIES: DDE transposase family protein [Klebsiella]|uniref:DDE transposase family protein n=2 Tax=Klebsiella/Raoultella group TaxID=2890311 RepID=UPI0007CCF131|nr:DDE transposase family protein [Klebsiella pneumoniae]AWA63457.1 DDE transposase family protein [Klebsiella pneumoniae]AXS31417.1 DDE transposase family protein [Klebsiella pneumoniae]AXU03268.1 DDE transposase family protein [Klebsiella pneumoniae]KAB1741754.1 DDE transposase family protein [Klebsiella pneumoniae]MBC4025433.1 DDE transposase family protein [Klebsiella pneumoniae]